MVEDVSRHEDTALCTIYCPCPDAATAERLGRLLIDERLAACVNLVPGMRSIYRWQGAVETAEECLLLAKTTSAVAAAARARLVALHPYAVPCVMRLPVADVHPPYAAWVAATVGDAPA